MYDGDSVGKHLPTTVHAHDAGVYVAGDFLPFASMRRSRSLLDHSWSWMIIQDRHYTINQGLIRWHFALLNNVSFSLTAHRQTFSLVVQRPFFFSFLVLGKLIFIS
jgi:hypothetical protein